MRLLIDKSASQTPHISLSGVKQKNRQSCNSQIRRVSFENCLRAADVCGEHVIYVQPLGYIEMTQTKVPVFVFAHLARALLIPGSECSHWTATSCFVSLIPKCKAHCRHWHTRWHILVQCREYDLPMDIAPAVPSVHPSQLKKDLHDVAEQDCVVGDDSRCTCLPVG